MKKTRILAAALALALAAGLLTGCGGGAASSGDQSGAGSSSQAEEVDLSKVTDPWLYTSGVAGDMVVARAGEYEITAASLLYWLNASISQAASSYVSYGLDIPWDSEVDEQGTTMRDFVLKSALETATLYRLLPEIGAREGLAVDPAGLEQLEASQADLAARLGDETLARHYYWLAMTSADLLKELYQAGEMGSLLQEHFYGEDSGSYPTDAEVLAYADDEVGYYKVKHILLATVDTSTQEPLDEAARAEKKKTAEDLLAQLRAAEDPIALFDELMNEYSEDPGLASYPDGYDAAKGQMYPEFEEASLALQVGEISDIVESESGYHIILRMPPDLDMLRREMVADRMADMSTQWLEENPVETTDDYKKIDPATYWGKAYALQQAVYAEISPVLEAGSADGSSGAESGASASGSSSQG